MYRVMFSEQCVDHIVGLDDEVGVLLYSWIKKNLFRCTNPRAFGKSLYTKDNSIWQYRFGNHRLLAVVSDEKHLILCLDIVFGDTVEKLKTA